MRWNAGWHLVTAKKEMKRTSQKLQYSSKFFTNTQLLSCYWRVTGNNDLAQVWGESNLRCSIFPGCQHLWVHRRTKTELTAKRWCDNAHENKETAERVKNLCRRQSNNMYSLPYFSWNLSKTKRMRPLVKQKIYIYHQVAQRGRRLSESLVEKRQRKKTVVKKHWRKVSYRSKTHKKPRTGKNNNEGKSWTNWKLPTANGNEGSQDNSSVLEASPQIGYFNICSWCNNMFTRCIQLASRNVWQRRNGTFRAGSTTKYLTRISRRILQEIGGN